jgi:hypothetical protein
MPPLPVIPDVFRVTLNWGAVGGTNPKNVMHIHDGTGVATAADVAAVVDAGATSDMWNCLTNSQECDLLSIIPLDGSTASTDFNTTGSKWLGQQSGEWIPQAACVIKMITGLRGRSNRGRMFVGPVAEAIDHNGFYVAGPGHGLMQTAWASFQSTLVGAGMSLAVASYKLSSAHDVTAVSVETTLGTQRRRQSRLR